MTQAPAPTATPNNAALRQAARALIASTLAELIRQDEDWLGACRKRIKDRMSDAKHTIFNNEKRMALLLLGRTDEIPALALQNRQMERTALVCSHALQILDELGGNATRPAPARQRSAGPSLHAEPTRTRPTAAH